MAIAASVAISVTAILILIHYGVIVYNLLSPIDKRLSLSLRQPWKLPPGPRGYPLLGNLLEASTLLGSDTKAKLTELSTKYGEMTTLRLGSRTWIILNTHRVAQELIVKRTRITSERGELPVASGIVSRDMRSLIQRSEQWKENRRVTNLLFHGSATKLYETWQEEEGNRLINDYLNQPDFWCTHNHRYANRVLKRMVFGTKDSMPYDELLELAKIVEEVFLAMHTSMIDWFPALARLPKVLQFWRPKWEAIASRHNASNHRWYDSVYRDIRTGSAGPSWLRDVLLNPRFRYQGSSEQTVYLTSHTLEAGTDTTRVALDTAVAAIAMHPAIARKLRTEVDELCQQDGKPRLPDHGDLEHLPFIAATVKEVVRWVPRITLTPEHTLTQDLEFEGYRFPAGVSFVINGYAVANDCEMPDKFMPERWLDGNEYNMLSGLWQFGGGARVCPGYRVAQRSLQLHIARLVQCFDLVMTDDFDARVLDKDFNEHSIPLSITLRNESYRELITNATYDASVV